MACISLLSMYKDEDDEIEDLDEDMIVGEQKDEEEREDMSRLVDRIEHLDEGMSLRIVGDEDSLNKFLLPPPPVAKCSEELQEKISKFISIKKSTRRSFNTEVRNRKKYRNPDLLQYVVTYQDIDQIGSCFSKDVFNPHGYAKSDFYDQIEADMRWELERREQERKKNHKLELQAVNVVPTPKINIPTPGFATVAGRVSKAISALSDVRQNKKSKRWDASLYARQNKKSKCVANHANENCFIPNRQYSSLCVSRK